MMSKPENRFPEGALLSAAAVLGSVMVLALLLLGRQFLADPAGDQAAAEEVPATSTTTTAASTTTGPPPTTVPETVPETAPPTPEIEPIECPTEVPAVLCDAARFVQIQRGLPFKEFPAIELLPDAEFDAALLDGFDEYRAGIDGYGVTLQALGLLDTELTLFEIYERSLAVGVVGFYDTETGRLVVRGDDLGLYTQYVAVHELTHALDDQWFELDRETADAEADYAFNSVIEGNATRVEEAWRTSLEPADRAALADAESAIFSPDDLEIYDSLPPVVLELDSSPYVDGYLYVDGLAAVGGEAAVDAALTDPPTSSEEVLHPLTDRVTDPEADLPPPPTGSGGAPVDEGRLGELTIRLWLGTVAAEGWSGDRYVSWVDEQGRSCITVDLVGDTPLDQSELEDALASWAAQADDRSMEPAVGDPGAPARATGCR